MFSYRVRPSNGHYTKKSPGYLTPKNDGNFLVFVHLLLSLNLSSEFFSRYFYPIFGN